MLKRFIEKSEISVGSGNILFSRIPRLFANSADQIGSALLIFKQFLHEGDVDIFTVYDTRLFLDADEFVVETAVEVNAVLIPGDNFCT